MQYSDLYIQGWKKVWNCLTYGKNKVRKKKKPSNFDHVHRVVSMLFEDSTTIPLVSTSLVSMQAKPLLLGKGLCAETPNEGLTVQILSTQLFHTVNMFSQLTV